MKTNARSSRISICVANDSQHMQLRAGLGCYRIIDENGALGVEERQEGWWPDALLQFRSSADGVLVIRHGASEIELGAPSSIRYGPYFIEAGIQDDLATLDLKNLTPLRRIGTRGRSIQEPMSVPSAEALGYWFEALGALQSYATNSQELFQHVAKALVNPGGLDAASVLTMDASSGRKPNWRTQAYDLRSPPIGLTIQESMVHFAVRERTAVVTGGRPSISGGAIAAPFYDQNDEVAGVLYGSRILTNENRRVRIRALEACWIQVVAESLTAGLKRFAVEQKQARTRFLFGRSFCPPLLEAFEKDPEILNPQQRNISVMFADLRNFTSITEQIGSERSFDLLTDVMNRWTAEVMKTQGVILDFYGDGLAAMWNAPSEQLEHAYLACETAQAIQEATLELRRKWNQEVSVALEAAIGIATGDALVGNAGSDLRLKYGPRGSTVNLGSRLESAAKKLGVSILLSDATCQQLNGRMPTRRIGRAALPGFSHCRNVYELLSPVQATETYQDLFSKYEQALDCFEHERYDEASQLLEALVRSEKRIGGAEAMYEVANAKPTDLAPSIRLVGQSDQD